MIDQPAHLADVDPAQNSVVGDVLDDALADDLSIQCLYKLAQLQGSSLPSCLALPVPEFRLERDGLLPERHPLLPVLKKTRVRQPVFDIPRSDLAEMLEGQL